MSCANLRWLEGGKKLSKRSGHVLVVLGDHVRGVNSTQWLPLLWQTLHEHQ